MIEQTECVPYAELPADRVNCVVPPRIEARMTGAVMATQTNTGLTTLTYEDYSQEAAVTEDIMQMSWFAIVERVQDTARRVSDDGPVR